MSLNLVHLKVFVSKPMLNSCMG